MTGGYTWDNDYVWDSWANFQWAGFLAGRLWLLQRPDAEAALRGRRDADLRADRARSRRHPTVFSSTGIDMYYALTLGYQIPDARS